MSDFTVASASSAVGRLWPMLESCFNSEHPPMFFYAREKGDSKAALCAALKEGQESAHGFLETNQRESINIISSFGFAIPYDHPEPELSVGNPSSVFIMMKTRSRAHSHEQLREPPPCFPALAAGLHTMHLSCLYHSCGNLPISSKLRHFGE